MTRHDLMAALDAIDPAALTYNDWEQVGMALHHEGYGVDVWDSWSRSDRRYKPGECERKWRGFGNGQGAPVTGGTIVKLAFDNGWRPAWTDDNGREHHALTFDSVIGGKKQREESEPAIVDATIIGDDDVEVAPLYAAGHGHDELRAFLDALFEPSEYIGYVTDYQEDETSNGELKCKPGSRGVYSRTMGEIREGLAHGIENALSSTLHEESGAWVRINPLDGAGVGNANVTDFRHALLESDEMPKGKFASIVKQLNLPVVAMVDSGNKSLHAIVRVDAADAKQYAERVNTLYARCEKNGIKVDRANKNPSRMTRMPGVMRNGSRQFLVSLKQGAGDWEEWEEWYAAETDELPDAVPLDTMLGDNLPSLKPALIDGLLRVGHKMLVSGPSKAGKSFALIALCIAFAEGGAWFGMKCRQSRVMYVNLELDSDSCINRFNDMYEALGIPATNAHNIDVWNLRGKSEPFNILLPKLIRRCLKRNVEVVIIDPIYKVQTGDENSAGDMARFANLFDELCDKAGVSAIYCHHHSKGFQGEKRSIDRASGSGVFGRDPDAILDMVELSTEKDMRWARVQDSVIALCERAVAEAGGADVWDNIPVAERATYNGAIECARALLPEDAAASLVERCDKMREGMESMTAWRISATLREFPSFKPIDAWFVWPLHVVDASLADCTEVGNDGSHPRGKGKQEKREKTPEELAETDGIHESINREIAKAIAFCLDDGEQITRKNIMKRMPQMLGKEVTEKRLLSWTDKSKDWCDWVTGEKVKSSRRGEKIIVPREGREEKYAGNELLSSFFASLRA